jgi:hypothetical protein
MNKAGGGLRFPALATEKSRKNGARSFCGTAFIALAVTSDASRAAQDDRSILDMNIGDFRLVLPAIFFQPLD